MPSASIVIPTRGRPEYLAVTLTSVAPQAASAGAELIVVDDGHDPGTAAMARAHAARLLRAPAPGANAARNAGIDAARGDPVVLIDDDVRAPSGWLAALLQGVAAAPEHEVFGGPIVAVLEGGGPRACGCEPPPITNLDCGPVDRDVSLVWSANMAIRRGALQRVGRFDETIHGRGEEEDWQRRYAAQGGRVRYLAAAGLEHRRTEADARLRPLTLAAYRLGRTARLYDARKGRPPKLRVELRTLVGCLWHATRGRCASGIVLAGHACGRLREALAGPR
ncbi:MAG: glycosyltransferase family 2 protein, partial [Actinomycetota bacterium]|nr:glycosyltransferase family 2 protein [Actinomycetota bacterium]